MELEPSREIWPEYTNIKIEGMKWDDSGKYVKWENTGMTPVNIRGTTSCSKYKFFSHHVYWSMADY